MAAIHAVRPQPQQPRTVAAHSHPQKRKQNKRKTRRQGVAVCVWRCGCLPALAAIKQNKRERNVCSAPQALVTRPHVTAPSARGASRPLLMRAAGEAHRAVVMSVSVGVRVEPLGGKHTAPLTGRVQQQQIKKREIRKKNAHSDCPQKKKEMGVRKDRKRKKNRKEFEKNKQEKKQKKVKNKNIKKHKKSKQGEQ
ncbi:hypothetical protein MOQ_006910 [Trypanosoma cruzi marinkellei]|uniref:Uncharacterized protein n=1 Tax=Trypanosoma cruzi marinkellei TaxID=85056 RepID=K2M2V5_TRYCR|nr:hypothetical protein MOQ_006910 [Trypanosoma cruzi marinkellei]